jgi:hypothetical protein
LLLVGVSLPEARCTPLTACLRRVLLNATSSLATGSGTTFRGRVGTCSAVRLVDVSGNADSAFAARCLALLRCSGNANTTWSTVADRDVISYTDAGLAARRTAVSGNIWSRSTGRAVRNIDVIGYTDAGLAARCAAVSGDIWSGSTGCTVSYVAMRLNADPGLATGHLTVACNSVGTRCAVFTVNHRAPTNETG